AASGKKIIFVIAAGIGVKDDFLAGSGGRRNKNHGEKEQEEEESNVAGCSGQTAYRCATSSGVGTREQPNFLGQFPFGHTAPRTACCSSLQKQTPRQDW